jgi:hypothetical protein
MIADTAPCVATHEHTCRAAAQRVCELSFPVPSRRFTHAQGQHTRVGYTRAKLPEFKLTAQLV